MRYHLKLAQHDNLADSEWKAAFDLIQKAQHLPLTERRAFAESATSNPAVLALVQEMWDEEAEIATSGAVSSSPARGDRFGRYEILSRLGAVTDPVTVTLPPSVMVPEPGHMISAVLSTVLELSSAQIVCTLPVEMLRTIIRHGVV